MGLSASQARLLTITARKSDCEFQSMRYSHEKIALSRDLTDISNEYQNALNATKLVYDYYGVGSNADPLSYGLMMTPSEVNGHLPILATDNAGRVVLNSKYAAAARAAGIPNEGYAALPSSIVRNLFIDGLCESGIINENYATTLKEIQYSQDIGVGNAGTIVTTKYSEMTLQELINYLQSNELDPSFDLSSSSVNSIMHQYDEMKNYPYDSQNTSARLDNDSVVYAETCRQSGEWVAPERHDSGAISLTDILTGNYSICTRYSIDTAPERALELLGMSLPGQGMTDFWDDLLTSLVDLVGSSPETATAAAYARAMTEQLLTYTNGYYRFDGRSTDLDSNTHFWGVNRCMVETGNANKGCIYGFLFNDAFADNYNNEDYIGLTHYHNKIRTNWDPAVWGDSDPYDGVSVNVTNIAKAFLTYFAQEMNGIYDDTYYVSHNDNQRRVDESNLIDLDDTVFKFSVQTSAGVNSDQALTSGFYDALFNQICLRGWTENDNVDDKEYLQEMLKNGKLFLAKCADDGYYYQGSYAINTMIKEVTDEEAIAKAEAKYNTEKQKINHKEEIIDMKMKNLDTEISSLTTEYETIKSVLKNNIDKSFTRYDA